VSGVINRAIIPAAGFGTRGLPVTKAVPKEMFPIGNRPAIHYVVEEAVASGIEEILVVLSRGKTVIMDYFDRSLELEAFLERANKEHLFEKLSLPKVGLQYIRQDYARGLGDAVRLGRTFASGQPVAVLLPDEIILNRASPGLRQLVEVYETYRTNCLGLRRVRSEDLKYYGVIDGYEVNTGLHRVEDIIEKPQSSPPSNLAVVGRYILMPEVFNYLDQLQAGVGGEIQLTDAIKAMLPELSGYGRELSGERYDIGIGGDYQRLVTRISREDEDSD